MVAVPLEVKTFLDHGALFAYLQAISIWKIRDLSSWLLLPVEMSYGSCVPCSFQSQVSIHLGFIVRKFSIPVDSLVLIGLVELQCYWKVALELGKQA